LRILYRGKKEVASELHDVPFLNTNITIKHDGKGKSTFTNSGKKDVYWQPEFTDNHGKHIVKPKVKVRANGGAASAKI